VEKVALKEASKIEITSLMDNSVDFLSSPTREEVRGFWQWSRTGRREMPIAEHGFSMLIKVCDNEDKYSILFDTGVSPNGVVENARRMGIDLKEVAHVVLSHGHYDHFGGLKEAIKAINKQDLPIIVHENMLKRRGTSNAKGEIREYSSLPKIDELSPAKLVFNEKPLLIAEDYVCVTGEIPRKIDFEKGLMQNRIFVNGVWQPDHLILDDRALVLSVKGKGLVVISGCAHAGIINTVRYAQQITGIKKTYAVLGGFHLAGKEFEKRIAPTVEDFRQINPTIIGAGHCTGWRALYAMSEAFPDAFVFSSVGTRYILE
jgi:7,8-dihydropterin-6-yl-methyl-4-(beta-D-ribofuranosyl)aminobenzene 5'-phosphate synthase